MAFIQSLRSLHSLQFIWFPWFLSKKRSKIDFWKKVKKFLPLKVPPWTENRFKDFDFKILRQTPGRFFDFWRSIRHFLAAASGGVKGVADQKRWKWHHFQKAAAAGASNRTRQKCIEKSSNWRPVTPETSQQRPWPKSTKNHRDFVFTHQAHSEVPK